MRTVSLPDLQCQVAEIADVLGAAYEMLTDMNFGAGPNRNVRLERVCSLISVLRSSATKVADDFDSLETTQSVVTDTAACEEILNVGRDIMALRQRFDQLVSGEAAA